MSVLIEGPSTPQQSPEAMRNKMCSGEMPAIHPQLEGVFYSGQDAFETEDVVVTRRTSLGEPEHRLHASFYEELVEFSDGTIRTATRGIVNRKAKSAETISPYVVTATDALCTGPTGHNKDVMRWLTAEGYDVEWLHHQGRHGRRPSDAVEAGNIIKSLLTKSVKRSAQQQHAYLNDLETTSLGSLDTVIAIGESRGGMTGEAVIALAATHRREVAYSDFLGQCFEHRPSLKELVELRSLPLDIIKSLGRIGFQIVAADLKHGTLRRTKEHLGTFDLHPFNIANEVAWIAPLMSGEAGIYADLVPSNSNGTRVLLNRDKMSQVKSWQERHARRPGIRFVIEPGDHIDLADEKIQSGQRKRFQRLMQQMQQNNFALPFVDFNFVTHGQYSTANVA